MATIRCGPRLDSHLLRDFFCLRLPCSFDRKNSVRCIYELLRAKFGEYDLRLHFAKRKRSRLGSIRRRCLLRRRLEQCVSNFGLSCRMEAHCLIDWRTLPCFCAYDVACTGTTKK